MKTPLITVIVPIYNVEKYLRKCVESILAQTYTNLEIILVDDGSPDGCPAICDEYAKKDSRIKVIHKENGGLSSARNAGLDIASGDYIGFVDSDDYIAPEMYEKLYYQIIENNAEMAICNYDFVDDSGRSLKYEMPIPTGVFKSEDALAFLQIKNYGAFVSACNRLFVKKLFNNFRFPLGKLNEDNYTAYQLMYKCNIISMISSPMYFYLQRADSIMHKKMTVNRFDDIDAIIKKTKFYKENGFDKYVTASELQILNVYRFIRVRLNEIQPQDKIIVEKYDNYAESLYKKHITDCSWKDHLFFRLRSLYIILFRIKEYFFN